MLAPDAHLKDRYRIVHQIGRGGFGTVYKAVDEVFGCSVAIKETKEEVASHEKLKKAFEREAKLLRNLKHECLPRVTDYFLQDNAQYLVMDFIEGEDLASLLKRRIGSGGPFSVFELLPWADRILSALDYLHSLPEPIIHRDIKPANIKLANDGEIYLLDFGLAKGTAGQMSTMLEGQSSFSIAAFTHEYAPLEQLQESGTRPQSDIYAFGATLYHLLTAQIPIAASKRDEMIQRGLSDPLRPACEVNPAVPLPVSQTIESAMIVRWWDRLSSARHMRAALSDALATSFDAHAKPFNEKVQLGNPRTEKIPSDQANSAVLSRSSVPTVPTQAVVKAQKHSKRRLIAVLSIAILGSTIIGTVIMFPRWFGINSSTTPNTTRIETAFPTRAVSKTPTELHPQPVAHHVGVWSVAFSPDGSLAATASKDNTVILWETKTWKEKVPDHLLGQIVAFSPDGNILATGGGDKRIRLWDTRTGKSIDKIPPFEITKPVYRIAFSADSALLASFSADPYKGDTDIQVWDLRSNFSQTLRGEKDIALTAIAFWPRQNILFSAGYDYKLRSWKVAEGAKSQVVGDYPNALLKILAFSPDGNVLACASRDRTIKLLSYQPQSQQWLGQGVIQEDNGEIVDLVFSPDSKTLVGTGKDNIVRMWDVSSLASKPVLLDGSKVTHASPAFSSDSKTMLTVGDDTVWLWH